MSAIPEQALRPFYSGEFDRIEILLERRANLLGAATRMLQGAVREGRLFTDREQAAWDYAADRAGRLGAECDTRMGRLAELGYRFPRPAH